MLLRLLHPRLLCALKLIYDEPNRNVYYIQNYTSRNYIFLSPQIP